MAKRRGVGDDINKFVSDIVSPWLGSGPRTPPQVQRGQQLARTLVEQADQFGTGGLGRAAMAGPTELAKQAAINAAAAATGMGAAKVAGKITGMAVESGLAARIANKFRGEVIGLHGSPVRGLTQIEPRIGTYAPANAEPLAYAANPRFSQAIREVEDYAMGYSAPVRPTDRGSIYVIKANKNTVVKPESGAPISSSPIFASRQPMKVVEEVSMYDLNRNQNLTKILKRAGARVPKKK